MKPRILFILHIPPPVHGAAVVGKYIVDSKLINEAFDADYINLSTSKKLSEMRKGGIGKIVKIFGIQWKILKSLITKKYDLCYVTLSAKGPGFYKDLLIVVILKLFRKKIIYHFHNKGISKAGEKKINDLLYRYTFKNTYSILLSWHLYYDVEKYVKKENVFICPNGIPDMNIDNSIKTLAKKDLGRPVQLLYLGNIMVEKGVYVLLDACKKLNQNDIFFECHFVGGWSDIEEEDFKNKIAENNLSGKVFCHGPKYGEDKYDFLKKADVFVFPTFYNNEALPIVNLEAMQYALPIVSTPEGGIRDEVVDNETGLLAQQKNADDLMDKLNILINNEPLRHQMGIKGALRFKELFTLKKFEQNLISIFSSISK